MKKFFLSLIFYLFCFPILGFFGGEENMKEICTTDIDGKDRNPPMVTNQACFDNFSCPLISDMKKNHYLLLVDTTDGLSKNEIGFLKGDVLDPKTLTQMISFHRQRLNLKPLFVVLDQEIAYLHLLQTLHIHQKA